VLSGLELDASWADLGIRNKRLIPKKTAVIQMAVNPTGIR
jgi:hypothetical protein